MQITQPKLPEPVHTEMQIRVTAFLGALAFIGALMGAAMWMDQVGGPYARANAASFLAANAP